MDAMTFVYKYELYIDEISMVVKDEYEPIVQKLRELDPHDLVKPESWFPHEQDARGYVWSLFLVELRKSMRKD